ncbi:MAG TPA: phosphotransferase [Thermoanaerobaculia bacterium]|nr:phosphotransferase [Thermoanaerobaculia bacterium]
MKVVESGRLLLPAGAVQARRFANENLLSVHRRRDRWLAALVPPRLSGRPRDLDASPSELAMAGAEDEGVRRALEKCTASASEWLLLRDYPGSERAKQVLFLFDGEQPAPYAVMKIRPLVSAGGSLERERDALAAIRPRLPEPLRATLPEALLYVRGDQAELLVLSGVPGQALAISMQRSIRPHAAHTAHAASAGAWLGSFHLATSDGPLRGRAIDRTAVHGDFWPRNVLGIDGRVSGVIDWEKGEPAGPFWRDVFTFPLLFSIHPGTNALAGFRRGFVAPGAARRAVAAWLEAYSRTAAIDFSTLRGLFEAFVVDSAHLAGKEGGWRTTIPWSELQRIIDTAGRSVFSG